MLNLTEWVFILHTLSSKLIKRKTENITCALSIATLSISKAVIDFLNWHYVEWAAKSSQNSQISAD